MPEPPVDTSTTDAYSTRCLGLNLHRYSDCNNQSSRFASTSAIAMSTPDSNVPTWVSQLRSPPGAKARVPGVPDPIGFSSGPSGSKVRSQLGRHGELPVLSSLSSTSFLSIIY